MRTHVVVDTQDMEGLIFYRCCTIRFWVVRRINCRCPFDCHGASTINTSKTRREHRRRNRKREWELLFLLRLWAAASLLRIYWNKLVAPSFMSLQQLKTAQLYIQSLFPPESTTGPSTSTRKALTSSYLSRMRNKSFFRGKRNTLQFNEFVGPTYK